MKGDRPPPKRSRPCKRRRARPEAGPPPDKGGRAPRFKFADYRNLFPGPKTAGIPIAQLYKALMPNGEIKKNNLHLVCKRWEEDGDVIITDVPGQPRLYRAAL